MSLWSSVPCQAVLLSLSYPEGSPQGVLCVNETSGTALLPVVHRPLFLCRTLAVTVCSLLVVVFYTAFPSAFALGSFQCLRWESFANLVEPDTRTGLSICRCFTVFMAFSAFPFH